MSTRSPFSALRRAYGLLLFVCVGSFAMGAQAQIPVTDGAHIGINNLAWVEQQRQKVQELANQVSQIQNQIREIEQQFVGGQAFQGSAGYRDSKEGFQRRALTHNLSERCGTSAPSGITGRVGNVATEQHRICGQIVQMENRRYNAAVEILERLEERDQELDRIREQAASVPADKPGELQRVNNNLAQAEARLAADMENARILMDVYEATLRTYNEEQVRLARAAYGDGPSRNGGGGILDGVIGQVVQYGALRGALEIARTRDR